jgi:hypothetical protein
MLRRAALAGALIASVSCNKPEGGDGGGSALVASAGSGKTASAGGSFSTDLAKELAGSAKGSSAAAKAEEPAGAGSSAGDGRSGSAAASEPKPGVDPRPGSDAKPGADARPVAAAAGDKSEGAKSEGAKSEGAKSEGAKSEGAKPAAGEAKPATAEPAPAGKPGAGAPAAAPVAPAGAESSAKIIGAPAHGPVKVPADLAAIKLSLLPNWDRDIDEPGTFQYVVRVKGTQSTKTFTFRYGYDDAKAPADHDQYKKYLQDTRTLTGDIRDRQRGAAWFLEGNDAAGMPAFRYVVVYGGKRLICYGSLYKDADSNRLGDDRDQTLIQAKQICETLAL